ncbi:concanavalin A-like lectin/glucanase [Peniophora sp. CONT]|nr:concanavalin A-like lectin/glucanase [Peniophora sp. CONT]
MKFQILYVYLASLVLSTKVAAVHTVNETNWAGSVNFDKNANWKQVSGTIVVPTPHAPAGATANSSAWVWVGIDGASCPQSILQTGIGMDVKNNVASYSVWYEWAPTPASYWPSSQISVKGGDTVYMSVVATSSTSGTTTVINRTTNQTATHTFSNQSPALRGCDASWIVEDPKVSGVMPPLANFTTVTFTGAESVAGNGSTYGPAGNPAESIAFIWQNGKTLTSCSATTNSATCTYI